MGKAWGLRPVCGEKRWKEAVSLFSEKAPFQELCAGWKGVCCPVRQAWLGEHWWRTSLCHLSHTCQHAWSFEVWSNVPFWEWTVC